MLGPGNECYNNFSPVEAAAPLEELLRPPVDLVDCASWPEWVLSIALLDSAAAALGPDARFGLLVPGFVADDDDADAAAAVGGGGGGWPGAFFNCQLLSSIEINFFSLSRYWLYSSTSLCPAPSTHSGSTALGHFS